MDHARFASSDSPFYADHDVVHPDRIAVALEPGWLLDTASGWTFAWPDGGVTRTHGWKIHLSLQEAAYEESIGIVARVCSRHGAPFKFVPSSIELRIKNAKDADRLASGKAVTIYPSSDAMLEQLALALSDELRGRTGPYVLTDVRFGSGPVFFRHGAFLPLRSGTDPFSVPAVPDASGRLVPDVREPGRIAPDGVERPAVVEVALEAYAASGTGSPLDRYGQLTALHHSNAGGVYLSDSAGGPRVVLKEARRGAGLDRYGHDAVTRLVQEEANLTVLEGAGVAPRCHEAFDVLEHRYLVMDHVEGETLSGRTVREHPALRPGASSADWRRYFETTSGLLLALREHIGRCHAAGVVIGDLHPSNIMVTSSGSVVLLDLEDGRRPGQTGRGAPFNALGYGAPSGLSAADADWFAFSRVVASTLEPDFAREQLAPGWSRQLMKRVRQDLSPDIAATIDEHDPSFSVGRTHHVFTPDDVVVPIDDRQELGIVIAELSEGVRRARRNGAQRPYPGDPRGRAGENQFTVSYGLAGVLHSALARSEAVHDLDGTHLLAGSTAVTSLGLLDGSTGVASTLVRLGWEDEARQIAGAAKGRCRALPDLGLRRGRCGIALGLLGQDPSFTLEVLEQVATDVLEYSSVQVQRLRGQGGLFDGWAGMAFTLASVAHLDDRGHLAEGALVAWHQAVSLLRRASSGSVGIAESRGDRVFPYLANGSAGLLVALAALRRAGIVDAEHGAWRDHVHDLVASCSHDAYVFDGLFHGLAGVVIGLRAVQPFLPEVGPVVTRHQQALARRRLSWRGTAQVVGDGLLRLSTDLATGSSGVLLALDAAPTAWLPVWPSRELPRQERG